MARLPWHWIVVPRLAVAQGPGGTRMHASMHPCMHAYTHAQLHAYALFVRIPLWCGKL